MRVVVLLVLAFVIIGLSGFASASWLSHEWKEFKQNIKVDWKAFTSKDGKAERFFPVLNSFL
ncbi:MAG: hypothetical protein QT12_C0024G0007 [archaeon GW2011_AR21]|nr:MAG: hypothetical protein QT12_C0024G0007 [archaeon GW2011_AR21]